MLGWPRGTWLRRELILTGMSNEHEIQQLREEVRQLRDRLEQVSRRLDTWPARFVPPPPAVPPVLARPVPPVSAPPLVIATPPPLRDTRPPVATESFEIRLGTVWLPRIGVALVLVAMTLFAAYFFPRLTAPQKLALCYAGCVVLCGLGWWLESRTPYLARVMFAGGLALTYFVTYAAHHVAVVRVIDSATVGMGLLTAVVVAIIIIAQRRQSALLAGLALGFGYLTTLISAVATFTLAANALLAVAAVFFLWRNRWVPVTYLAVLATYLTYMLWVWRLNAGRDLGRLIFDRGYLDPADFRLRAVFLAVYWLLFAAGGLLAARTVLDKPERNGLLTLNNAFFFILFALLMHHAWPDRQWVFLFSFAAAVLASAALAHRRLAPDRSTWDWLVGQGLCVTTLGVLDYFQGAHLVAALALESVFLVLLARALRSRWIGWIGRTVYAIGAAVAWSKSPGWDTSLLAGGWFAVASGVACARLTRREEQPGAISWSSVYFAVVGTALAMTAGHEQFSPASQPWVWVLSAVIMAGLGAGLRTRALVWAAHLPLTWAFLLFLTGAVAGRFWRLDHSLALTALLFGFGVVARAGTAGRFWPYAGAGLILVMATTLEYCPAPWWLLVFALETVALVGAGLRARDRVFIGLGMVTAAAGFITYLAGEPAVFSPSSAAWVSLAGGLLALGGVVRLVEHGGLRAGLTDRTARQLVVGLIPIMTAEALVGVWHLVGQPFRSMGWAGVGVGLLAAGFVFRNRPYRLGGLVALGLALGRVLFYDLGQLSTPNRILSTMALGVILLVLAFLYAKNRAKLARWL